VGMALDEPKETEQPVEVNGIGVLLDDAARPYVDGTTVDYIKQPNGEGFVFTGAGSSC